MWRFDDTTPVNRFYCLTDTRKVCVEGFFRLLTPKDYFLTIWWINLFERNPVDYCGSVEFFSKPRNSYITCLILWCQRIDENLNFELKIRYLYKIIVINCRNFEVRYIGWNIHSLKKNHHSDYHADAVLDLILGFEYIMCYMDHICSQLLSYAIS